jgi:hypothetical protein
MTDAIEVPQAGTFVIVILIASCWLAYRLYRKMKMPAIPPKIADKTPYEVAADPVIALYALSMLGTSTKWRLWLRHVRHSGMYIRLRRSGLSDEVAWQLTEMRYPQTFWDACYFRVMGGLEGLRSKEAGRSEKADRLSN